MLKEKIAKGGVTVPSSAVFEILACKTEKPGVFCWILEALLFNHKKSEDSFATNQDESSQGAMGRLGRQLHGECHWQLPMVCHHECAAEARHLDETVKTSS